MTKHSLQLQGNINKGDIFQKTQKNIFYVITKTITRKKTKDSSNGIWYRVKIKDSKCNYWELSDSLIRNLNEYVRVFVSKNKIKIPKRKRKEKEDKNKKRKKNIHWDKTVTEWPRIGQNYQAFIPMLMNNMNLDLTFQNVNETIDDMTNFINILKNRV